MSQGPHSHWGERRDGPRAAQPVLGKLIFVPALGLALASAACDQGSPDFQDYQGPPVHIVATYPAAGATDVPRDASIKLRFDRFLLPKTAVRQSITLYTGSEDNAISPLTPQFDVVERVVEFKLPAPLQPTATYTVVIPIPVEKDDEGFRAFDGAALAEGPVPLEFDFLTAAADPVPPPPADPQLIYGCFATKSLQGMIENHSDLGTGDVLAAPFKAGQCSSSSCHHAPISPSPIDQPRMGMDLESADGILATVRGQVAHEADTGSKTGEPLENPSRFGVAMPRVDPNRPENSYLLYKLVRKQQNYDAFLPCGQTKHEFLDLGGECASPSDDEKTRLGEWFVRGDPMPLPFYDATGNFVDPVVDLTIVQEWIRTGAKCP